MSSLDEIEIHPLARRSLTKFRLPEPIARYRPSVTERINTNPYAGELGHYPTPCPTELQAMLADYLTLESRERGHGGAILPSNILFTAGSLSGIDLLVRAFCEPFADRICVPVPTFPGFGRFAVANDVDVVEVRLGGANYDDFDAEALARTGAKLFFLCSPNNPMGSSLDFGQVVRLLEMTDGLVGGRSSPADGLVVVDEAYIDFSSRPSFAGLIERHPRLVVLRTFSKAWGLAALRAGVALGAASVVHTMRLLSDPFGFNTAAQQGVRTKLRDVARVREGVERIRGERARLSSALSAVPIVRRVIPSDANFLFVELHREGGVVDRLASENALVSDTSHHVPMSFRISVSTAEENDRVVDILRSIKGIAPSLREDV
jgi:histidinol-phosphate aminotransferase